MLRPVPPPQNADPIGRPVQPPSSGRRLLHLRSGDTIPCDVTRIDEKGVTLKTPFSDATFVAHEKIKGVELIATRNSPQLDETKRDRLLTLPRLQKNSPPTHLICSTNGDFLRGRVLEMDEARLKVEVRLETREIPRDRLSHVLECAAVAIDQRNPGARGTGQSRGGAPDAASAPGDQGDLARQSGWHRRATPGRRASPVPAAPADPHIARGTRAPGAGGS